MQSGSSGKHAQRGFTLTELLVALGILALLGALTVPAVGDWLPGYRLRQAAGNLYGNFQFARMGSVRANSDWALVFDPANGRYWVCSGPGADQNWSTVADNVIERSVQLSQHGREIIFGHGNATAPLSDPFDDHVTYPGNVAVLSPRGTADNGTAYLESSTSKGSCAVGTSAAGVVYLRRWDGNGWS